MYEVVVFSTKCIISISLFLSCPFDILQRYVGGKNQRGHLDKEELVSLLNSKLTTCERFSSRIEISPNHEDAHFIDLATRSSKDPNSLVYDVSDHIKPLYVTKNIQGRKLTESEKYAGLNSFLASIVSENMYVDIQCVFSPPSFIYIFAVVVVVFCRLSSSSAFCSLILFLSSCFFSFFSFFSNKANVPIEMPADKPQWEVLITQPSPPAPSATSNNKKKPESEDEEDETVLIFRIHHALADGVSGVVNFTRKHPHIHVCVI
jgi:hypothetical protein